MKIKVKADPFKGRKFDSDEIGRGIGVHKTKKAKALIQGKISINLSIGEVILMVVTNEILEAFEVIRKSGKYNMFDAKSVVDELGIREFWSAFDFVVNNKGRIDSEKYAMVLEELGKYNKDKNAH